MKTAAVLIAACLLAACGPRPAAGGGPPAQGTVEGTVLSWPCAPVEVVGSPCPGRPAAGVQVKLVLEPAGPTSQAMTDGAGRYSIVVPPGRYTVSISGALRVLSGSRTVEVTAGGVTHADFVFDSGIR